MNNTENSSDSCGSYIYTINDINKVSSNNIIKLRINNCNIDFQIDSGASVSVICEHDFNKLKKIDLKTSNTNIFAYGLKASLTIKGCFYSNILFNDRINYAKFYVISGKNKQENLLGIDSVISLGVL